MRCNRTGCEAEATHALKMVIPSSSGMRPTAAEGLLGVVMCDDCFGDAEVDPDFLCDPVIRMLFQGVIEEGTEPSWGDVYLEAVDLGSPDYKAWRSLECVN